MYPMPLMPARNVVRHIFAVTLVVIFYCSFVVEATAKNLSVPDDYSSIKQAVAAAQPQDIVRVAEGEYFENISLGNGVVLQGGWNRNFTARDHRKYITTINGMKGMGPVVFGADNAMIEGFTIKGGKPPMMMPDAPLGPGLYCSGASEFTVRNNAIIGNNAAGIYFGFCSATVVNNIIAGNGQSGIFLENSALIIAGNRIAHNLMAGIDVGVVDPASKFDDQISKVEISDNIVHNNKRAGINTMLASGKISNNIVYKNDQAGIRCGTVPMLVANNTVNENQLAGISVANRTSFMSAADFSLKGTSSEPKVPMITNNIIVNNGEAGIKSAGLGYTYNLLHGNNKAEGFDPDFLWYLRRQFGGYEDQATVKKTNNILADPMFVDPARYDYHLQPGSPAIDAGDPSLPFNDRNFGPSLGGDTNDIGAYGGPNTIAEPRPSNVRPDAKITLPGDQIYVGDKIVLNGGDSLDPNGDEIHFEWNLSGKPAESVAVLSPAKDGKCNVTLDKRGLYTVRLTVTDRWGMQSIPAMTYVTVKPDRPPSAKINKPTKPINVGGTVTLFAYDKKKQNGAELTYLWNLVSAPVHSKAFMQDRTAIRPSFSADVPGCYSVMLKVNNGKKTSEPDTAHICTKQSPIPGVRRVPDDYPTIQIALDTADAGENVIVQAGTYKENLIIDKAVNLIGVGRPVIDGGGKDNDEAAIFICYLDNTASGRIQGFTITGGGAGQYGHAVQLLNSSPEIVGNYIFGNKHAGIGIHGMKKFTEKTKIHDNLIYDNAIGISNGLGASGQIYNNKIYDNRVSGIGVRGLAEPVIKNNAIYQNYIGIGVREEAYPSLEGNRIYENTVGIAINPGVAGAVYAKKDKINIRNNRVYGNRQCGIFISSLNKSEPLLQKNMVNANSIPGSDASRSGDVVSGYPGQAVVDVFMATNKITDNNGKDIQRYRELADSAGEVGSSKTHRPSHGKTMR